jgi:hypothetical protein
MTNRKYLYVIFAIVILMIVLLTLLVPRLNQQAPVYNAKIVGFTDDGPYPLAGVTMITTFNITVKNFGDNPLSGLNITMERSVNGTINNSYGFDYQNTNFTLRPNETLSIIIYYTYNLPAVYVPNQTEQFSAKLLMGSKLLDERNF